MRLTRKPVRLLVGMAMTVALAAVLLAGVRRLVTTDRAVRAAGARLDRPLPAGQAASMPELLRSRMSFTD